MTVLAGSPLAQDTAHYCLRLGDDALVLAQRLSEWVGRSPQLEQDVALANIALDLLGQARALLGRAGELDGTGRDEDQLAFGRHEAEFVNCQLVELDGGDFARTMGRLLMVSAWQLPLYTALQHSSDEVIAGVAAKAVKEVSYHLDHARSWVLRLGDGTPESTRRMQDALDQLWPHAGELFQDDDLVAGLVTSGVAVLPSGLQAGWQARLGEVMAAARLVAPTAPWRAGGGRRGIHTEEFGFLLADLQYLPRAHPGARW